MKDNSLARMQCNTHLSLSGFPLLSCWDYSTAAVVSLSKLRRFDRLHEQSLYVCSAVGSAMTFGHAESKQRGAVAATQHRGTQPATQPAEVLIET